MEIFFVLIDNTMDGWSINRPHVLDGKNYDYWKAKMLAFLISIDIKTWKVVVKGLKHLVITYEDGSTSLKPGANWSKDEYDKTLGNDKALNVIFNGVDKNMFRLIQTCIVTKEA